MRTRPPLSEVRLTVVSHRVGESVELTIPLQANERRSLPILGGIPLDMLDGAVLTIRPDGDA